MKIILIAVIVSMLLVGIVAADDRAVLDLSTKGKDKEESVTTPDREIIEIKYAPKAPTTGAAAIDVRTLGRGFGTFGVTSKETLALGGPNPVTYTPPFSISISNRTLSRTTVYTPPFSVGSTTVNTPAIMIFGGK